MSIFDNQLVPEGYTAEDVAERACRLIETRLKQIADMQNYYVVRQVAKLEEELSDSATFAFAITSDNNRCEPGKDEL
jgi:hypothetical protein